MTLPAPAALLGTLPRLAVTPELPTISTEWVLVPLQVTRAGVEVDLTTSAWPVWMTFVPGADPDTPPAEDAVWYPAGWYSETRRSGTVAYYARILVGPGGSVELPAGDYLPWLAWTADDEAPKRPAAGPIRMF